MELRDAVRALRRRLRFLLACAVAVVALVLVLDALRAPTYASSAQLLLGAPDSTGAGGLSDLGTDQLDRFVATQILVAQSDPVTSAAATELGVDPLLAASGVTFTQVPGTSVVQVTARRGSIAEAQDVANAFSQAFQTVSSAQISSRLSSQVTALDGPINDLQAQVTALQGAGTPAAQQALDSAQAQLSDLVAQQQQLRAEAATAGSAITQVSAADIPLAPVAPKPTRDAVLALLGALVLAGGYVLLRELLDERVHTAEQLDQLVAAPLLVEQGDRAGTGALTGEAGLPASVRGLRVSLDVLASDTALRALMVTSPAAGPDPSRLATDLAAAVALAGRPTILLSVDPDDSAYVTGRLTPRPAAGGPGTVGQLRQTSVPGLRYLRRELGGPDAESQDVSPDEVHALVHDLLEASLVVILDAPGMLDRPERGLLAAEADGLVLVVPATATPVRDVRRVVTLCGSMSAQVVAAVLAPRPRRRRGR